MQIGLHRLKNIPVPAPMAGVTDQPFRQLCRKPGAGLAVPGIVTSDPGHHPGSAPRSVRIAGAAQGQPAIAGIRIARKHLGWYLEQPPGGSRH